MPSTANMDVIEGTWEEISRHASEFNGHRLRVVILPDEPSAASGKMITQGMFPQLAGIEDEDFKIAEYHMEDDDESEYNA